ncbi:hypothetical protein BHM03_00036123 [Ensete ventricosum]|nr:hypothetical protein BHM03_00036123 [Ensete ventricosum]
MFQAIYHFSATSEKELSLEVGDYVVVRQVSFLMLSVRGSPATGWFRQKSTIGGRLREKPTGRKREEEEEKKKKRRGEERIPRPRAVAARRSPTRRRRPRVTRGRGRFFSCVRRRSISPRGEKDRGDVTHFLFLIF